MNKRFSTFAWGVLGFNVLVIIWGAFVRATGSGAGCGSHWPLCNGELVPRAPQVETLIEFSHRITSGIALLGVVALLIWAMRSFPRGHHVRKAAGASMFFMVTEALVGAGLVLFEYVAHNVSIARAYWMAGHLTNTFLLLAALTLTAWWSGGRSPMRLRRQGVLLWSLVVAVVGMFVLGASGGITALGDTLVLGAGISPEESPVVATLVELRIFHPIIAFAVGGLVFLAALLARSRRADMTTQRLALVVMSLYVTQLVLGALNVALKAPVWLQMVHLLFTTSIWISLILLAASTLAVGEESRAADMGMQPARPGATA